MSSKILPKVSIITSVMNDRLNLKSAIKSVREQDYPNIEYIVIDGGSIDGTLEVIRENSDIINYWISEPDAGVYCAWNKGIRHSHGEWICFLGADDELKTGVIFNMITSYMMLNSPIDYISGKTDLFLNGRFYKTTGKPFEWRIFRKYLCTGHNAALHNRSLYDKYGLYNENFRSAGDYEFLLRVGESLRTHYVNIITSKMNLGGVSNNSIKPLLEAHFARKINQTNSYLSEIFILIRGVISYFFKKSMNVLFR
jgi:glycosyltransferase involved in cell wall biosynthesis